MGCTECHFLAFTASVEVLEQSHMSAVVCIDVITPSPYKSEFLPCVTHTSFTAESFKGLSEDKSFF